MTGRQSKRLIGALDIGTAKIACLICEVEGWDVRAFGLGHQRSRGVTAGVITDAAEAEAAIRAAVAQAERATGMTLAEVYVSMSCGRLASLSFAAHAQVGSNGVIEADVARLHEGARAYAERDGRALVHMNTLAYRLDGELGGENPIGMAAAKLTADLHAVTADEGAIRNILHVVERCHLTVAGLIAAPYASALAVTTQDERRLGVSVIDMGGGTTNWATFGAGNLVQCAGFATGGHHLTFDIAQNLRISLAEAERIKALYASIVNAKSDVSDRFVYAIPGDGEDGAGQMTRAQLSEYVRPRMETLLRSVMAHLPPARDGGQVVLTGGASQLVGLVAFASQVLARPVRLGRPLQVSGSTTGADSPAFATAVGLALAAPDGDAGRTQHRRPAQGYLSRVGRWIGSGL